MIRTVWLLLTLFMTPTLAHAWWNADWGYRKKISIDAQKLQQEGVKIPVEALALVRLHTGNFAYFADLGENGKDLRFMADDDKTPLKFYIEKIDPVNEMALIWVKLPKDMANAKEPAFWMYYSNPKAVTASEPGAIFSVEQLLDYHFEASPVKDSTSYGNQPASASNTVIEGGAIGEAAAFDGQQNMRVAATPAIPMQTVTGWTVSAWVKIDQPQNDGVVIHRDKLSLLIRAQSPVLELGGKDKILESPIGLNLSTWHHLAVSAGSSGFTLYVDGKPAGILPGGDVSVLDGDISVGQALFGSRGFVGAIDELGIV